MRIKDYVRPTLREIPTHIILHVGLNDVSIKKDPDQIAENIVNLAVKLKRNFDVSILDMTARNVQHQSKAADLNWKFKEKRREKS